MHTARSEEECAARRVLRAAFDAAVTAALPATLLPPHLPPLTGRTVLLAAGKAAVPMARVFIEHCGEPAAGVVVTQKGQGGASIGASGRLTAIEAGHPLPNQASEHAAALMLAAIRGLAPDDRVVFLVSGGGSALLARPRPPLTLADKRELTSELLACGAGISQINCVRKKLSAIKGGRLALASVPARMDVIAISDVAGNDLSDIASGPASPDQTTLAEARDILRRYQIRPNPRIAAFLDDPCNETPKPGDPAFRRVTARVYGSAADALPAAAAICRAAGYIPVLLGDALNLPAATLAREHADIARRANLEGKRVALISGGETTVVLRNRNGRGGRNGEYLLHLALALDGAAGIYALAADTDGIDGTQDNAGAFIDPATPSRAAVLGLSARALLDTNCSWDFFSGLGDVLVTGPTGTNVNDLRIILIGAPMA